jgi:hypothetical protein
MNTEYLHTMVTTKKTKYSHNLCILDSLSLFAVNKSTNFLLTNQQSSPHLAPVAGNNLPVCQDVHVHARLATEAVWSIIIIHRINLSFGFVKILLAHVTMI